MENIIEKSQSDKATRKDFYFLDKNKYYNKKYLSISQHT